MVTEDRSVSQRRDILADFLRVFVVLLELHPLGLMRQLHQGGDERQDAFLGTGICHDTIV
jgi:hypothetical protein